MPSAPIFRSIKLILVECIREVWISFGGEIVFNKYIREDAEEFHDSEAGSLFNHGAPDVSDAAGAALWLIDFALFSGLSGVKRVHFHQGIGYKYNMVCSLRLLPVFISC